MTKIRNKAEFLDAVGLQPKKIEWVVEGLCAKRKVSVIASEPGAGASLFAIDLVARVSSGSEYPIEMGQVAQGNVLFVLDDKDATERLIPRLIAAKVDRNKVHAVQAVEVGDEQYLAGLLEGLPVIDLMVVDVNVRNPKASAGERAAGANELITRLYSFAEGKDLAVVTVVRLAIGATETGTELSSLVQSDATIVSVLRRGADNSRNVVPLKNSYSADTTAYSFSIVQCPVADGMLAPHIEWNSQFNASIMRPVTKSSYAGRRAAANAFAHDNLFDGKMVAEYLAEAKAVGLSDDMVRDAAEKLGFVSKKGGFGGEGHWVWREIAKEDGSSVAPKKIKKNKWGD